MLEHKFIAGTILKMVRVLYHSSGIHVFHVALHLQNVNQSFSV